MIPVACPFAQYQSHWTDIYGRITKVLTSGVYIGGEEVERFEWEFAEYTGARFAIGVSSGLDALILSLQALGIGHGDEVITVAMTAPATVQAIKAVGATPIVVDVAASTRTIDNVAAKKAITPQTKAIIPVHLYGQPCEMVDLGVPIIEDCAQATGAHVGTFGELGCFSFYPTKNLGAIGDGGMVITSNWWLAKKVRELRLSHRLDPLQAAILSAKLPYLDEDVEKRQYIAKLYGDRAPGHVYHLYVIESAERDRLRDFLADKGVGTAIHYAKPAYPFIHYAAYPCDLPVTSRLCREVLSLPMYPELTDEQVDHVVASLRQWNALNAPIKNTTS